MCGIAGYINKTDTIENTSIILSKMLNLIKHRGPDDSGIHLEDNFGAIGMQRLSIQDLSNNGHQPMYDKTKNVCIVYNGEVYNAGKKRDELIKEGYIFKSNSDTEVILNLYLKFNEDCLLHLEGMFAFAIIDKRKDNLNPKLFIARDQIGIKPIYYVNKFNSFAFCSELTPIIATHIVKPLLNQNSIKQLLNYGSIKQPNTIFQDITMLMPGHKLIFQNGEARIEKYWNLQDSLNEFRDKQNYNINPILRVENSLRNSVKEQLCGDVKIGTFLSGGIDSSLIAALLSQESNKKINTYSVGFNTDSNIKNELSRAKLTAKYLETHHNEIIVDEKYVLDNIEKFITSLDQPTVDGINSYIISDYTSKDVKVALSGTGGDELFAGYPWFRNMQAYRPTKFYNKYFQNSFFLKSSIGGKIEKLYSKSDFLTYFSKQQQIYNFQELTNLLQFKLNYNILDEFESSDVLKNEKSTINRTSGLLLNTYLLNQLLRDIDVCSMSNSLEIRVPFLSLDVIHNALDIDDSLKLGNLDLSAPIGSYRRNGEKIALFEIAKKYLPPNFDLIPKNGFTLPFDDWLKGPLREQVEFSIKYLYKNYSELFNENRLLKIKHDYYKNKLPWYKMWLLLILGKWLYNINKIAES
jgi:asparagine synthase (glutamine-hydrolysing)